MSKFPVAHLHATPDRQQSTDTGFGRKRSEASRLADLPIFNFFALTTNARIVQRVKNNDKLLNERNEVRGVAHPVHKNGQIIASFMQTRDFCVRWSGGRSSV